MNLIIVIAHKNEDVGNLVSKIKNFKYIVIRDLCSKQGENEICIRKYLGKGEAVKLGLEYALEKGYKKVLILDSDAPVDEKIVEIAFRLLDCYDFIYGVRFYLRRRMMRKVFSKLYVCLAKIIFPELYSIRDFQAGFKGMNYKYLKFVLKKFVLKGFAYDVNLIYYARWFNKKDFKLFWKEERSTFSKRLITNSFKMLLELLYFRLKSLS